MAGPCKFKDKFDDLLINYIFETDSKTLVDTLLAHNIPLKELFNMDSKTLVDILLALNIPNEFDDLVCECKNILCSNLEFSLKSFLKGGESVFQ